MENLATMTFDKWAPGVAQFRGYRRSWLRGDVLAGVTVAAYLVPQVMAYATVAGLPPVAGLWASLAPMARYAALAAVLAVLVGGICLVGGLCRLGFLADLLSRPVLVGYMTGVAIIMV